MTDAAAGARDPLPRAGLLRRYAAVGYEGLLLAAIVWLVGLATVAVTSPGIGSSHALAVPGLVARIASGACVFAVVGAFYVWSWTGGRRTLPMKTWRLVLERRDGRAVDLRCAVIRYLAAWIGPLAALAAYAALAPARYALHAGWLVAFNYLWALVDPDRQFLHDRIAGTRIVYRPPPLAAPAVAESAES